MKRRGLVAAATGLLLAGSAAAVAVTTLPVRASGVTNYTFSPNTNGQFAPRASLTGSQFATVTVTALNGSTPVSGATVFLSQTGPGTSTVATVCGAATTTLTPTPAACTTGAGGTITVTFQAPASGTNFPPGGVTTIIAQDAATSPTLVRSVEYFWSLTTQLVFDSAHVPVAQPGAGARQSNIPITVTAKDGQGNAVGGQKIFLTLAHTGMAPGGVATAITGGNACTSATTQVQTNTSITADSNGQVLICYTPPAVAATAASVDAFTAADASQNQSVQAQDFYNLFNQALDHYGFSPSPIASAGTLGSGASVPVTATANTTTAVIPYMTVYLTFAPPANGGSATATDWTSTTATPLSSTPTAFVTDGNGAIAVSYTSGSAAAGTDTLGAQNTAASPTKTGFDYYNYHGATHYVFSPNPIAARNSAPTNDIPVTLTAEDSAGTPNPVPNSVVWLTFSPVSPGGSSPASAKVGTTPLSTTPQSFVTDQNGAVTITYTPNKSTPTLPTGGQDILLAQNAQSSPTFSASDVYQYGPALDYQVSPKVAPTGSLTPGQSTPVVFSVFQHGTSTPQPNQTVYMSFTQASGGGSAASAQCTGATLSATPVACTTSNLGQISVTYSAPSPLPAGGTDSINAADATGNPTVTAASTYTYVSQLVDAPTPIAPDGSLAAGAQKTVTVTAKDAQGNTAPGANLALKFVPASGGGSAAVGSTQLTSSPQTFTADGTGKVSVTYKAPSSLPNGGTDTLTALSDTTNNPTITSPTTYTFGTSTPPPPPPPSHGYYMVASDGGIFPFGSATQHSYGSTGGQHLNQPIVGMAVTSTHNGYYLVASDGGIFPFGDATQHSYGSTGNIHLNQPIVGMAVTPSGNGYWLVAADGGIFPFGDATQHSYGSTGNMHLNAPIVGMAPTASGNGYYLVASDGGLFPFGDALQHSYGSEGGNHLNQPVVGMAVTSDGNGYYLVASDGGIFPFGSALQHSYGSTGGMHLNQPIVGMALATDGNGYYLVASDGGLFPFGSAQNASYGSEGGSHLNKPIVGMAAI